MKTIFDISESEKKEILNLHNVIKESLNTKLSKKTLNEQQAQPQQQTRLQYTGTDILKVAMANQTCRLAFGGQIVAVPGKPSLLRKVADYDSASGNFKVGDILFLSDNLTFDVYKKNPTQTNPKNLTKLNTAPIGWTCQVLYQKGPNPNADDIKKEHDAGWKYKNELGNYSDAEIANLFTTHPKYNNLFKLKTDTNKTGNLSAAQQAWYDRWSQQDDPVTGQQNANLYKTDLSDADKASGAYIEMIIPGSEKAFAGGIKVWYAPNNLSTVKDSQLSTIIKNQTIDREACKKNVIDYANSYKNHLPIPDKQFDAVKRVVQACAYQYYNKWGILGGGRKLDADIDMLRGGPGGPTTYGEYAKWRLK